MTTQLIGKKLGKHFISVIKLKPNLCITYIKSRDREVDKMLLLNIKTTILKSKLLRIIT